MAYIGRRDHKLTVVEAGCIKLHQDLFGAEFVFARHRDVLLVLERGFEAFLAGEDPLSGHAVDMGSAK